MDAIKFNCESRPITPTVAPSFQPTVAPSFQPTVAPSFQPTVKPTMIPSYAPTEDPSQPDNQKSLLGFQEDIALLIIVVVLICCAGAMIMLISRNRKLQRELVKQRISNEMRTDDGMVM